MEQQNRIVDNCSSYLLEEADGSFFLYDPDSGNTNILTPLSGEIVEKLKAGPLSEGFIYSSIVEVDSKVTHEFFQVTLKELIARDIVKIKLK